MSIADELAQAKAKVAEYEQYLKAAYTALQSNGASLPEKCNAANLAGCIEERLGGIFNPEDYDANYGAVIVTPSDTYPTAVGGIIPVTTEDEFNQISKSAVVTIADYSFRISQIVGYVFGNKCSNIPNGFCSTAENLYLLFRLEVIRSIGDYFCNTSRILTPLKFSNQLTSIGDMFLGDSYINTSVHIPASVTNIGAGFMSRANFFRGPLIVDGAASPTDGNSLSTSSANAVCYTKGIKITGAGASAWKSKLPNRTSSSYRKLILDPE